MTDLSFLDLVEIEAKGGFTQPPLDLAGIEARAAELDPKSQLATDMYRLIAEVKSHGVDPKDNRQ